MGTNGKSNGVVVPPFVHLDVQSAFGGQASPSTPDEYVRALAAQHPINGSTGSAVKPAIALADTGLQSTVKMAVACAREDVDHVVGLRVRLVPTRAYRAWGEQPGELILLAMDETGWLNLVALNNLGHLAGSDRTGPRVDWLDVADHSEGLVCLTGAPGRGLLPLAIERSLHPNDPVEALALARRLRDLFGDRLYFELAFHGRAVDKLVNRGLVALSERLEVGVVATNAVRYARPEDALSGSVLASIRRGVRADAPAPSRMQADQLPNLAVDHSISQAFLKSPGEMWRLFGRMPTAVHATSEVARRCRFRLPLAERTAPEARYGPALLFGLEPARQYNEQQFADVAEAALRARWNAERSAELPANVLERARSEVGAIQAVGCADLLLAAHEIVTFCKAQRIPVGARGSATSSLVAWALGLTELCPLDHHLDGRGFVYEGRPDLPDLDLEVSGLDEPRVARFLLNRGRTHGIDGPRRGLAEVRALRIGVHVSMGARQAVRAVGTALGLEPPRVNALARLVPLLSSPGAIEEVMTRTPELGIHDLSTQAEPYNTVLRLAGQLEGLPQRAGPHPSAYVLDSYGPGLLSWLPAHFVGTEHWTRNRQLAPRNAALTPDERSGSSTLAHVSADPPISSAANGAGDEVEDQDLQAAGGPTLVCQWDKDDLEALGVCRLDVSPSPSMAGMIAGAAEPDRETAAAAWRLLEAGDTLCIPQIESVGMRMLLKRARASAREQSATATALSSVEDLAQLLALWRPGAYSQQSEQAYFDVRFARERPAYPHPSVARVLDFTSGQLLYSEQVVELVGLLGFDWAWADAYRRALVRGHGAERAERERGLRLSAKRAGWTAEQSDSLIAMLLQHAGYLHSHGHALVLAHRAFRQACLKVSPEASAFYFAEILNHGGSTSYGMGAAVEETRRFGVLMLPPCVNRSSDRFIVETDAAELEASPTLDSPAIVGAVRVPLTAIRGLSSSAAQHILAVRSMYGPFESLLDFLRKIDADRVTRADAVLLIKLGAFAFTGHARAKLALAEQFYSSAAELLRAADRDPSGSGVSSVEGELPPATALEIAEWPPETLAAYDLAHLGFYVSAPFEVQRHMRRLSEEFGVAPIAELVDLPDRAPAALAGIVTALRIRTTKKGERMAWLTLADATGAVEAAVFPRAYEKSGIAGALREGAFLVVRGRLAHEEATGTKVFIDDVTPMAGRGTRLSALTVAVQERRGETAPWASPGYSG